VILQVSSALKRLFLHPAGKDKTLNSSQIQCFTLYCLLASTLGIGSQKTLAHPLRKVTVVNPTTSEEEKRVLYEIALSHLARRTFVGNLYKQVKDPNLVGSLSGHKEGSKAFARYREIDEQMKRELVDLLK
jgi:hypothetical protein